MKFLVFHISVGVSLRLAAFLLLIVFSSSSVNCSGLMSRLFLISSVDLSVISGGVGRVIVNGPGDRGSIPGRVIPKTLKMVLDTSLPNTQQQKVRIKGKVEQSR